MTKPGGWRRPGIFYAWRPHRDRARLGGMSDNHLAAVRDPYTTEPGAFTAALALGLVEMHEGQPRRTEAGEEALRKAAPRDSVLVAFEEARDQAEAFERGTRVTVAAEPGLIGTVTGPSCHMFGGLGDMAKVWIQWPDGGASGHHPSEVQRLTNAPGGVSDQHGEDTRF
jgi:hypothetical protein